MTDFDPDKEMEDIRDFCNEMNIPIFENADEVAEAMVRKADPAKASLMEIRRYIDQCRDRYTDPSEILEKIGEMVDRGFPNGNV